ncbi:MAG: GAF domain-containing protein [Lachnospiraceae bacterium]|nr:GAF domain-containing protein [Lachnospiraceae bacterium]
MNCNTVIYPENSEDFYDLLKLQVMGLTEDVPHFIANISNISALLKDALQDINWVGFYFMKDGQLVLGPFQGKPACIEIAVGRGVCGTAVAQDQIQLVKNVHDFPGHIACDSASNSEIVVPMHVDGKVVGVLDIDSPTVGRFSESDAKGLSEIIAIIEKMAWFKVWNGLKK